jgi:hypothetical protein
MQVIEELIQLAKDLDAATKAGQEMGLTDDEKALTSSRPLSRASPIASRCLPAFSSLWVWLAISASLRLSRRFHRGSALRRARRE